MKLIYQIYLPRTDFRVGTTVTFQSLSCNGNVIVKFTFVFLYFKITLGFIFFDIINHHRHNPIQIILSKYCLSLLSNYTDLSMTPCKNNGRTISTKTIRGRSCKKYQYLTKSHVASIMNFKFGKSSVILQQFLLKSTDLRIHLYNGCQICAQMSGRALPIIAYPVCEIG